MIVLPLGSSISAENFWSCDRVATGLMVPCLSLIGRQALERVVAGLNVILFIMTKPTVYCEFLGVFKYFLSFHRFVYRCFFFMKVHREFLGFHGLVSGLTGTVNCENLYAQLCAFLNHPIQSNQLNLPQVDSSQVLETFQVKGNKIHMNSICSTFSQAFKYFEYYI